LALTLTLTLTLDLVFEICGWLPKGHEEFKTLQIGTISNLRLGYQSSSNQRVPFTEINDALGQCLLLLSIIESIPKTDVTLTLTLSPNPNPHS
jgi:hypothetical protein